MSSNCHITFVIVEACPKPAVDSVDSLKGKGIQFVYNGIEPMKTTKKFKEIVTKFIPRA